MIGWEESRCPHCAKPIYRQPPAATNRKCNCAATNPAERLCGAWDAAPAPDLCAEAREYLAEYGYTDGSHLMAKLAACIEQQQSRIAALETARAELWANVEGLEARIAELERERDTLRWMYNDLCK